MDHSSTFHSWDDIWAPTSTHQSSQATPHTLTNTHLYLYYTACLHSNRCAHYIKQTDSLSTLLTFVPTKGIPEQLKRQIPPGSRKYVKLHTEVLSKALIEMFQIVRQHLKDSGLLCHDLSSLFMFCPSTWLA